MWLNMIFLTIASLSVGFILGWLVARPRRWGAFADNGPGDTVRPESRDQFTHGAKPGA